MLGVCTAHASYLHRALKKLRTLAEIMPDQIREYKVAISKMLILNLDPLINVIKPLYPACGRTAERQIEIFRSLILMSHIGMPLNSWVRKLYDNPVLRIISGFEPDTIPGTSSFYDFINRVFPLDEKPKTKAPYKKRTTEKIPGKGEKLPPKNPGIVARLVERLMQDEGNFQRQLSHRPERHLQRIFARVAVDASTDMGLVSQSPNVSGDGTCIRTGASIYGKKVCGCTALKVYRCNCDRKYSDPSATWGWDSHNEEFFYGYSGYFISAYNKTAKVDLPLYLRLFDANRHDSVSAIFALTEFRQLSPNLHVNTFISDSACDNYATYELLDHLGIHPVIALNNTNKGNLLYPGPIGISGNGVPICPAKREMYYHGYCKGRRRFKWRCPRVVKGLEPVDACGGCSDSDYGRVFYTKSEDDLRMFTSIPRGTNSWKAKMKERTAAERVNNRILHDYGVEVSMSRGKKRISFNVTLAGINIHLDAQLKYLQANREFDFDMLIPLPVPNPCLMPF